MFYRGWFCVWSKLVSLAMFVFCQKTAYEWRISDWSSDVCASDLAHRRCAARRGNMAAEATVRAGDGRADRDGAVAAAARRGLERRLRARLSQSLSSEERRVGEEGVRVGRSRW